MNYKILVKYCVMAISRNSSRFLMELWSIGIWKYCKFAKFIKFFLYNVHLEQNETDTNYFFDETRDSCSYSVDGFFLIYVKKSKLAVLTTSKGYSGDNYLKEEDSMAVWSFLIHWIHCPLALVLRVNPETANAYILWFKEVFCLIKSNIYLCYTSYLP